MGAQEKFDRLFDEAWALADECRDLMETLGGEGMTERDVMEMREILYVLRDTKRQIDRVIKTGRARR